ncbi:copper resistance CopC/CopD family protein [Streptomyces fulvoviolaceus]|uniref:copper resistance CopC/CopD family protein n=1 Tax=Streptomyces fulvoviolaceus TaxID=285535 RepID=UPI0004C543CB|nr:copper resistance protein CopC [Streptomyces fulvoviolaceus]MCT9079360.1 copper resistance protein CopC [Streptomyces fulvoviolaceus]
MLLGTVLVLLVLGGAGTASAHAALRGTDPEDGSVVKSAPRHLTLTFTESVGLLDDSFRVLGPDGRRVSGVGDAEHAPDSSDTARVTLPAKLAQGTYTVGWRVVSADSHPVSGAFTFSVGKPSPAAAVVDTGPVENPATAGLYKIARYLAYLAAALLIGTAVFVTACRPPEPHRLRRLLWAGWWTLLGSTLVLLVLRAPYETGTAPTFDASAFERTLTGRPGAVLLIRLALLALTALFLVRLLRRESWSRGWLATGTALAVALALTWAAAEHASAGIQVPVAMTSAALHVLAMAVWLGGLTALVTTLYRTSAMPLFVVTRFSRLAFTSVTVLVVTGVYQSWRGLGSWNAFTDTTYGRLLVAKLAAVALVLTAAACSRRWTARLVAAEAETVVRERVPETVGGPPQPPAEPVVPSQTSHPHQRNLRRFVLTEVAVGVVVLVISTVLSGTLPGRAQAEAAESAPAAGPAVASVTNIPFSVGSASGRVQITIDPARTGENSVEAVVLTRDGGFAIVPELRLSFTLPAKDLGPIDAELKDKGGYWATNSLTLPLAGDWTMKATIRVSEIDQVSESKTVRIVG